MGATTIRFTPAPGLPLELAHLAEPMLARLCLTVETAAKRNAPVKTGNLRRSITSAVAVEAGSVAGALGIPTGIVAATAHYAGFVELGTWKMQARPFLRRALIETIGGHLAGI